MQIKKMKNLFLRQSYLDSWTDYENSINKSKFVKWDYIILTASNNEQAETFTAQINKRVSEGYLPSSTHYAVLPDPEGKRVGSGGATFNVLKYIKESGCSDFSGKRILVIHSGGDSKRVPQYSACGKLFSPVPRILPDGRRSTLFDEFIISMSGVAQRIKDGMLVLSGDVLLLFNPLQIDFQLEDAAAISIKENVSTGQNHGVFLGENHKVINFLHKIPAEELRKIGAVNEQDCVNIDTGAILLNSNILTDLYSLIDTETKFNKFVNETARISFYADFLYPMAENSTLEQYYKEKPEGDFTENLRECRTLIWNTLRKYRLDLISLSPAEFIHFGTTKELLSLMVSEITNYEFLDWSKNILSYCGTKGEYACSNSYIDETCTIDPSSYIEDSIIKNGCKIGANCVISNIELDGVTVPAGTVLHGIKLKDGNFVARKYKITTNPKENDYWNEKAFTVSDSFVDSLNDIGKAKTSLNESFNKADTKFILNWQEMLENQIRISNFIRMLDERKSLEETASVFGRRGLTQIQADELEIIAETAPFDLKIRIYYYISKIVRNNKSAYKKSYEYYEGKCFESIQNTVLKASDENVFYNENYRIAKNDVCVKLPVRVNWGGGWSDTPPYCNEHGGTVLNAAVSLNGELPVIVEIEKIKDLHIEFESADSNAFGIVTETKDISECNNPFDMFALHKAALVACGIVPKDGSIPLAKILKNIGGGFRLSTQVKNIPRGSGLGTSSILAGACVKAIFEFFGENISENALYTYVLCMEQIMSTGGGWQDQVGGLTNGIKYIYTQEGLMQDIKCTKVKISAKTKKELNERFALIYTGQRRLARNLLREVVGKYISGNKDAIYVLEKIQEVAASMKFQLEKGNIERFAELLSEHWELSKLLDSGCTNTCIDQIFFSIEDMVCGKFISGAGGGGFLQVILKPEYTKEDLRCRLKDVFQDSGVDVWDSVFVF